MELLDSAGNSIFLTPVDFIGEEVPPYVPYRYVTVEVYSPPVNAPGLATLTILGQIRQTGKNANETAPTYTAFGQETITSGQRVPTEYHNTYNVRYQKTINVDLSTVINTQPIRFFKNPTTEYQEVVQAKTVLSAVSQSVVTSTSTGLTRSDLKGTIIEIESGEYNIKINRSNVSIMDWQEWARKVLWYGHRKGDYLYSMNSLAKGISDRQ